MKGGTLHAIPNSPCVGHSATKVIARATRHSHGSAQPCSRRWSRSAFIELEAVSKKLLRAFRANCPYTGLTNPNSSKVDLQWGHYVNFVLGRLSL